MAGRGYIGGGSIAAIMGMSPYSTPLQAYLEITGEMPREEDPAKRRFFDRRKAWEPTATLFFEQATGVRVTRRNERYDDAEFPWAKAEIDFETADGCNGETKTISPRKDFVSEWGDPELGDEPPLWVMAQVQWGLGVTGKPGCWVHGMLGLDDDLIYFVERKDDWITTIRQRAADFWRFHVEPLRPPPPTTEEDLRRLFPRDSGRTIEATEETVKAYAKASESKNSVRFAANQLETHELSIKLQMRDATRLVDRRGKTMATWKADARGVRIFRLL